MKSYQWCDFSFDEEMFPDATGYIKRLKDRGLKISVWINPYVGQASPLFKEGKKNGYFIKVRIYLIDERYTADSRPSAPMAQSGNGTIGKLAWPSSTSPTLPQ